MKLKHVISAVALTVVSTVASAGLYSPQAVILDMTNRVASGDMLTARDSLNPFAFIGCGVRYGSGGLIFAFCQAGVGEAEGEFFTCFTDNPTLVDAIKSISDFSFITFAWDVDGNCTRIGNSTQSFYVSDLKSKSK